MNEYVRTALTGWAAFLLCVSSLLLPYLLRWTGGRKPLVQRLWPHYWIGYGLTAIAFVHAWSSMRTANMRGINLTGLWLATFALVLLLWQVAIGLQLRSPAQARRRQLRTTHFWTMVLLARLIIVHIALKRP